MSFYDESPLCDINFSGLPGISGRVFNAADLIRSQALESGKKGK